MKRLAYILLFLSLTCIPATAQVQLEAKKLSSQNGLPDNNIRYIAEDSLGFLKMISLYNAYQYDGYHFSRLPHETFLTLREERKTRLTGGKGFIYDNLGNIVLTEQGNDIIYIDKKTGERISLHVFDNKLRQMNPSLKCMVVTDRKGYIWVSVNGNGLFVYDRQTLVMQHITKNDGSGLIDTDYIVYMTEDHEGNIWVSQEHYGVVCLKKVQTPYTVMNIGDDNRLEKDNEVRNLLRLPDGRLLVSSKGGKLMLTDGNLQNPVVVQKDGENYNCATIDKKGRLWLGSLTNGVRIGDHWYGSSRVDDLQEDDKGRMWACCLKKALLLLEVDDEGNYNERAFMTDIEGLGARSLVKDRQGTIWLGTDKGLFTFNPDELIQKPKSYRHVSDIPVMTVTLDSRNQIWIGTAGYGLGKVEQDGSITYLTREDGLPNNVVHFIVESDHHKLFIGTEDGCMIYNPDNSNIQSLYFSENKNRNYYNVDCAVQLDDGRMAFGSLDGIIIIDKDLSKIENQHSTTYITDLLINGVSVYELGDQSPIKGALWQRKAITLEHDQNMLTLYFSNFDYSRSHLAAYKYKMEGFDKDWNQLTDQNYATYRQMKPGKYTFIVRYRDKNGWGEEEQLLNITIRPSNWGTWWAWLLYLLAAILTGYTIFRQLRAMERLRQRLSLEKQLTDYKLKFFTNISHEFRTPLTLIQGAMEKISQAKDVVPGHIKQPLSNMEQSTNRMLRLINQLLEFRRFQNNKLSLSLVETDIIQFVYDIYIGFHDVADNRHITYTFTPFKKSYKMYIDQGHIDKIIYNLLSNAFKYTPERETISVNIRQLDSGLIAISVSDSGIGVAKEKQAELFDRFSTGRVSGDSIGIGLNLSQELARVHHGEVTYQENVPKGSVFTLNLPTDKAIYQESDFMKTETGLEPQHQQERKGFASNYRETKSAPLNPQRILVAEDNADLCTMIRDELSVYFEVDCVNNGQEALDRLKETVNDEGTIGYHLVVSDVMMPMMTGFELTRRIRADKVLNGLPVILLTALTGEDQLHKGLEAGADAYLEKPFSPKTLITQAINLIEQRNRLKVTYAQQPQKQAVKELVHNDADKKFLMQMDAYIDSHLGDYNLSVDVIAAHFKYGRTRFYNKVRNLTGKTPNDYIKDKRLNKAAELLRESSAITVAEVAYQVGINNPHYFAVNFKKAFGITPSGYQRGEQPKTS